MTRDELRTALAKELCLDYMGDEEKWKIYLGLADVCMPHIDGAIAAAVAAERESIAKAAENFGVLWDIDYWLDATKKETTVRILIEFAAAIRARGTPSEAER